MLLPLTSLFWILLPAQATKQLKAIKFIQIFTPFVCIVSIFSSLIVVLIYAEMQNHHWTIWNSFPFFGVGITALLMICLNLHPNSMLISDRSRILGINDTHEVYQRIKSGNKTIRLARAFSLTTGICILLSFGQFLLPPIISLFFR
ncbi:hypothetical protein Q0M94_00810 [Deinococcus radiomollis]|uniref:hypothetical protein n=1 Tax=Deinococcus radiomollis TaxID=468916 RepID=UPI003891556A